MKDDTSADSSMYNQQNIWISILNGSMDCSTVAISYLTGQAQTEFLTRNRDKIFCEQVLKAVNILISSLMNVSIQQLRSEFKSCKDLKIIEKSNIPQFSNFATAAVCVPEVLVRSKTVLSYKELGAELSPDSKSKYAMEKYGENHGKLAALLGLAEIKKGAGCNKFIPSALSNRYCQMAQCDKMVLLTRLCYRIPFVQHAVVTDNPEQFVSDSLRTLLAPSTFNRRISNAQEILAFALEK